MNQQINYLLRQFEMGTISETEKAELLRFVDDHHDLVIEEIDKLICLEKSTIDLSEAENIKWANILQNVLTVDKVPVRRISFFSRFKWVAAAILLFTVSILSFVFLKDEQKREYSADVQPGGNKATLTLASGKQIALNDIKNGDSINENGISISKTADGKLVYSIQSGSVEADEDKINTISTPNGGEWEVRLPDGSSVWLNSLSSLKYPLNIAKAKQRMVELSGEAYFEVRKDNDHPFIVKTEKQKLEVLGTHFNINSYADEAITKTTLFEGSVRVSEINDPDNFDLLKPGEQSILSSTGFKVNNVNVDEAIAWKNGYFMFNNERQESILKKIARWYNVQIEFVDPEAKDVMYYGTVSRFEKISKVLRKFEQTGEVRYDIKENKVLVYKD